MTIAVNIPAMPDIRAVVLKELKRRGWTVYRLVQELKGRRNDGSDVPRANVFNFLRKDSPSAINSDDLGLIFDALEIDPRPRQK